MPENHETPEVVSAVRCNRCGKLHDANGHTYLLVRGEILVGQDGGLVGSSFKEIEVIDPKTYDPMKVKLLYRSFAYCPNCLIEYLTESTQSI